MRKIKIIFTFFMCLVVNNALAITENEANQFVVDIGNQAIKILKIPVDDKEKRKNELQKKSCIRSHRIAYITKNY